MQGLWAEGLLPLSDQHPAQGRSRARDSGWVEEPGPEPPGDRLSKVLSHAFASWDPPPASLWRGPRLGSMLQANLSIPQSAVWWDPAAAGQVLPGAS